MGIRDFAQRFWKDICRDIRPVPKSLTVEVNPALKTAYRKEYRTYMVTLQLTHSATDMVAQTFFGGGRMSAVPGQATTSSYVESVQQKEALKKEAEAMQKMANVAVQTAQEDQAKAQQGMTKMQQDLVQGQRKRDQEQAQQLQEQADTAKQAAQKMEETQKIVEAQQSTNTSQTSQAAQANASTQPQASTPAQANPTTTAEATVANTEERRADIAELRAIRNVLKGYRLNITKRPNIENSIDGDRIVFEVSANSFRESSINPNMRPVIVPTFS
jgi:DNA polymerase III gamma/tau subunit